jgi:hypothetical protein
MDLVQLVPRQGPMASWCEYEPLHCMSSRIISWPDEQQLIFQQILYTTELILLYGISREC